LSVKNLPVVAGVDHVEHDRVVFLSKKIVFVASRGVPSKLTEFELFIDSA
jgi:hypothetical protein